MILLNSFKDSDVNILRQYNYSHSQIAEIQNKIHAWNSYESKNKYFELFTIVYDEKIVGMITLNQYSDNIISITPVIISSFQKQDIWKKAMLLAFEIAKNKGYKMVLQETRVTHFSSIALHKSLGFEAGKHSYLNSRGKEVNIFLKILE